MVILDSSAKGRSQLRLFNPTVANEISKQVNQISENVMTAVVESETLNNMAVLAPTCEERRRNGEDSAVSITSGPGIGFKRHSAAPIIPPGFENKAVLSDMGLRVSHLLEEMTNTSSGRASSSANAWPPGGSENSNRSPQTLLLDLSTPTTGTAKAFPAISWASIAALKEKDTNKPLAVTSPTLNFASKHGSSSDPTPARSVNADNAMSRETCEPQAHQSRVIWIFHCPVALNLTKVSAGINEGPIMSIVFAQDRTTGIRACCIIFQYSENALQFLANHRQRSRSGRHSFFQGEHLELGESYPADADIRLMDPPHCARRRLTVVRKSLFCDLSKRAFEHDVYALAGRDNVELIHVYNTGNATIILASVKCAVIVKKGLEERAKKRSLYEGASITFSKDPCETEIRLISVFHNGGFHSGRRA